MPFSGSDFLDGSKGVAPLLPGVAIFGLVAGTAAAGTGLGPVSGIGMSLIVNAGASQLAMLQLVHDYALPVVVIVTALIINLRVAMYSASIAPHLRPLPVGIRMALAYFLVDQAYAVSVIRFDLARNMTAERRGSFFFGAGLTVWVTWMLSSVVGYTAGGAVPPGWSLDFTIPLSFLALMVTAIGDRPAVLAAVVSAAVAIAAAGLPYNLGLLLGAVSGICAGLIAESAAGRRGRGA